MFTSEVVQYITPFTAVVTTKGGFVFFWKLVLAGFLILIKNCAVMHYFPDQDARFVHFAVKNEPGFLCARFFLESALYCCIIWISYYWLEADAGSICYLAGSESRLSFLLEPGKLA